MNQLRVVIIRDEELDKRALSKIATPTPCLICAAPLNPPWESLPPLFHDLVFTEKFLKESPPGNSKNLAVCSECVQTKINKLIDLHQMFIETKKKLEENVEAIRIEIKKKSGTKNRSRRTLPRKKKEKIKIALEEELINLEIMKIENEEINADECFQDFEILPYVDFTDLGDSNETEPLFFGEIASEDLGDKRDMDDDYVPEPEEDLEDSDEEHESVFNPIVLSSSSTAKAYKYKTRLERIKCDHCEKSVQRRTMNSHVLAYHSDKPKIKKFKNATSKAGQKRLNLEKCEICDKSFQKRWLPRHKELYHSDDPNSQKKPHKKQFTKPKKGMGQQRLKMEKCDLCNKSLQKRWIPRHREIYHPEDPVSCEVCLRTFSSSKNLQQHKETIHLKIGDFPCPTCHRQFQAANRLKAHLKAFPFHDPQAKDTALEKIQDSAGVCEECGKFFTRQSAVNLHKKLVHLKIFDFLCEKCSKPLRSKIDLTRHLDWHSRMEVKKAKESEQEHKFVCQGHPPCKKPFKTAKNLYDHRRSVHLMERKHECENEDCAKKFFNRKDLKRHMKTHLEVDLSCDKCKKRFSQLNVLRRHEKKNCRPDNPPEEINIVQDMNVDNIVELFDSNSVN